MILVLAGCQSSDTGHSINTDATKSSDVDTSLVSPQKHQELVEPAFWDTILVQDLNHDAIADTAFVFTKETIKVLDNSGDLMYSYGFKDTIYQNRIRFSCKLPDLTVPRSVWGSIANVGDLNKDGYAEVIICPGWFTSCWGSLSVYTYQKGQWTLTAEASTRICTEEPLKSNVIKVAGTYYLKGIKFEDGNDVAYKVRIKI